MKRSIRTSYDFYLDVAKKDAVSEDIYFHLTGEFNKFLMSKVLEGHKVTLPSRLGTLQIIGKKPKIRFDENGKILGLSPDWKKTKELWERNPKAKEEGKRVFHTNEHTGGYRYRYLWSKNTVAVRNKTLYALQLSRANKRAITRKIEEGVQYVTKN